MVFSLYANYNTLITSLEAQADNEQLSDFIADKLTDVCNTRVKNVYQGKNLKIKRH